MNRIPNLVSAACLATAAFSCGAPEARSPRDPAISVAPIGNAIVVRDELTVALFARLVPGATLPSTLTLTFNDDVGKVNTFTDALVQSRSGFVYAAPRDPPAPGTQKMIRSASSATVTIGSTVYPSDLEHAVGTISQFLLGPYESEYNPCPHCLTYFLCHCLKTMYDVDPSIPPQVCAKADDLRGPCSAPPKQFKPVP